MEANPTRFYKGISSYWRRRKYQKLESSANNGGKKKAVAKLGPAGGAAPAELPKRRRLWRIRQKLRFRPVKIPSLIKIITGIRDLYVEWMVGLSGKGSALALAEAPAWSKPAGAVTRRAQSRRDNTELKLMFQIYNALVESGEIEPEVSTIEG